MTTRLRAALMTAALAASAFAATPARAQTTVWTARTTSNENGVLL